MLGTQEAFHRFQALVPTGMPVAVWNSVLFKHIGQWNNRAVLWNNALLLVNLSTLFTTGCNEHRSLELSSKCCLAHSRFTVEHQESSQMFFFPDKIGEWIIASLDYLCSMDRAALPDLHRRHTAWWCRCSLCWSHCRHFILRGLSPCLQPVNLKFLNFSAVPSMNGLYSPYGVIQCTLFTTPF